MVWETSPAIRDSAQETSAALGMIKNVTTRLAGHMENPKAPKYEVITMATATRRDGLCNNAVAAALVPEAGGKQLPHPFPPRAR